MIDSRLDGFLFLVLFWIYWIASNLLGSLGGESEGLAVSELTDSNVWLSSLMKPEEKSYGFCEDLISLTLFFSSISFCFLSMFLKR